LEESSVLDELLAVEVIVNTNNNPVLPIFKYDYISDLCSYCNVIKELSHICTCKRVMYCSVFCAKANDELHKADCYSSMPINEFEITETGLSKKGLVGVKNLGNSCYINTALQCLSNTYELAYYFLINLFKEHINTTNPLGYAGDIAYHFAKVVKLLYFGSEKSISLLEFKHALSKYHPDVSLNITL
jgi:ubiquitin carboxyl-terminal hydrolase 4/11/15